MTPVKAKAFLLIVAPFSKRSDTLYCIRNKVYCYCIQGNKVGPESLTPLPEFIHFCIGTPYIPSFLGERKICVGFARDPRATYLKANTCFWKLQLPTSHTSFSAFEKSFNKAIEIEGKGFMIA